MKEENTLEDIKAQAVKIKDKFYMPFYKTYPKGKAWIYGVGKTPLEAEINLQAKK